MIFFLGVLGVLAVQFLSSRQRLDAEVYFELLDLPCDLGRVTDAELLAVLHNGKGAMPAWKGVLTEEQMQAVLKHVRSLAVPPYTPTASK